MVEAAESHTVSEFRQDAESLIARVKASGRPVLLTVEGRAEAVLQDVVSYEAMVDRLREMEDLAAVREGLAQADAGMTRPAEEFFAELVAG